MGETQKVTHRQGSGGKSTKGTQASTVGVPLKRKLSLFKRIKIALVKYQYGIAGVVVAVAVMAGMFITFTSPQRKPNQIPVNDPELVEMVNSQKHSSSIAKAANVFEGWTLGDVKSELGNVFWSRALAQAPECPSASATSVAALPESFDSRDKWPKCFYESFSLVRNCSASWATATADMLSNRLCIMDTQNYADIRLSPQDLLSCDSMNKGCSYGALDIALYHTMMHGIVSTTCFPYKATTLGVKCSDKCRGETPTKIESYCKIDGADGIKREILEHGPVTALMLLNDDLLVYGNGVYEPLLTARRLFDGEKNPITHGVVIVGWGEQEAGKGYWIVQTNFGTQWGENGFARISQNAQVIVERAVLAASMIDPLNVPTGGSPLEAAQENDEDEILEE